MPRALYLHVPFCPSICPYCDFHKMRRNEALVARYLARLEEEIAETYSAFPGTLDTIYFGGGTPSHLSDVELARVVGALETSWGFPARLETTLEADPQTFDARRLATFKALGFSRLSIGLQSTQDEVLRFLGRAHTAKEGLRALEAALAAGFEVSADLITAVPGQDVAQEVHALAQTGVAHISAYNLTIEAHTPFALRKVGVDEDAALAAYLLTDEILQGYGLTRYEVSNHALPGHEAVHNSLYWQGEHFFGLGPAAASFLPAAGLLGVRCSNKPIKTWLLGAASEVLEIDAAAFIQDMLLTGLRTKQGVDLVALRRKVGQEAFARFQPQIDAHLQRGSLRYEAPYLRASAEGILILDQITATFF